MAKPVNFEIKKTTSIIEALNLISFPIERLPLFFNYKSKMIETGDEIIARVDGSPIAFGNGGVSKGYQLVTHKDAFTAALEAFKKTKIPFILKSVSLDKDGAKMSACFQFKQTYFVTDRPGDILLPQLTIVNSYDGETALGFDLGSERLVCLNLSVATISDLKAKWMHFGKNNSSDQIAKSVLEALQAFESRLVPHYQKMASLKVTKDLAQAAMISATIANIIPQKIAHAAIHCVTSDELLKKEGFDNRSAWTLFNALTWTATHKLEASPTRQREIDYKIANAFKDGGIDLLKRAKELSKKDIEQWNQKLEAA